jgi:hypothetical protein
MRVSVAVLALAACSPPQQRFSDRDRDEPTRVRRIDGVVFDRASGNPIGGAHVAFEPMSDDEFTDANGRYAISHRFHDWEIFDGSTMMWVIDDRRWMLEPIAIEDADAIKHDIAFEQQDCDPADDDGDRIFQAALADGIDWNRRANDRLVDDRDPSSGSSEPSDGVVLTTRTALQFEADRTHRIIRYRHIDERIENRCSAIVTVGASCVVPNGPATGCNRSTVWLYGKVWWNWRPIAKLTTIES